MKHFYAVYNIYNPNTASMNRMLSYLDVWGQLDVEVTVVFLLPNRNFSKLVLPYKNIKVVHVWEKMPLHSYCLNNLLYFWYVRSFLKMLVPGDNVYIYGQAYLLNKLVKKKEVSVFLEKTEHPEVSNPGHWPYKSTVKQFVDNSRKVKGLFVISKSLKNYFVENGVSEDKVNIVNMMVDPLRFSKVRKSDECVKYVAYCGNVSNRKDGVDLLIKSFAKVSPKYPNLYLYIIGKKPQSPKENSNYLLAEKLGISEKVVFTGIVSYSEMPQMLKDATILALNRPNNKQAQYGFPTKLGEYLLTGNPVVITSVGDIPNYIKDGYSGMLSMPDDINDFAKKMEWLLEHPLESIRIGENGRKVALENFNNNVEAKKIIDHIFSKE